MRSKYCYGTITIAMKGAVLLRKQRQRNATVFTALSLLFPVYLFATRQPESISIVSIILALFLPIAGVIFGLAVADKRLKWAIVAINFLVFIIIGILAVSIY